MIDKKIKYKDIKGQKHMLAYITPGEAKTLEKLGGQKTMTPEGIPAYPPGMGDPNYDGSGGGTYSGSGGNQDARESGAMANQTQSTPDTTAPPGTRHNPHKESGSSPVSTPDITTTTTPNFSIHGGPTYKAPPNVPDMIGPSYVPGVNYNYVGPDSQFAKNTLLNQQLLNTPYQGINTPFLSLNLLGNTLGKFGYNKNTKFFSDNSIGGKINPATGKPFGYGIDGFKDYMEQRSLGNVGAYGGTELSQNAINARSGQDGIMDVLNTYDSTDDSTDDDTSDDELILRFLGADSTLDPAAAGLANTDELRAMLLERAKNLYTT